MSFPLSEITKTHTRMDKLRKEIVKTLLEITKPHIEMNKTLLEMIKSRGFAISTS